jgi:hypothetical protein
MRVWSASVLVAEVLLGVLGVAAQSSETVSLYADAQPYKDDPIATMKLKVPQLDGLKVDASQAELPTILNKAGEVIVAQMPRVPNLIALEEIAQEAVTTTRISNSGARGTSSWSGIAGMGGDSSGPLVPQTWRRFEYVILAKHLDGGTVFDESRKDLDKKDREAAPHGIGFGSLWLMFIPSNQGESSFRYLGTQSVEKHPTYVVAFAQDPRLVKVPGAIVTDSGQVPLLYQGVAWIDQETYKIVRIRTDVLAPLPTIKLWQATSTVSFGEVEIPKFDAQLWLPKTVEITWDLDGNRLGELHRYSNYRLFAATSRIVPN